MKTLSEILDGFKPSPTWKDRPMLSSYDTLRGSTQADLDGIGREDTFIPTDSMTEEVR